jgi:hypothetical protein
MAAKVVWAVYEGDWSMWIGVQKAFDISHMLCEIGTIAVADEGLQAEQVVGSQTYGRLDCRLY